MAGIRHYRKDYMKKNQVYSSYNKVVISDYLFKFLLFLGEVVNIKM